MNMFLNIIINVPVILISNRFNGAISSVLISIPIGSVLAYLFQKGMGKFNKKGLPEILIGYFPIIISYPILWFLGTMWIIAGSFSVITYSYIIKLWLNPEMDLQFILGIILAFIMYGATLKTKSVLYICEIVVVMILPFVVLYCLRCTLVTIFALFIFLICLTTR
ncbi:hypothetical protein [Neobacillus niacini]|uniref:hypothetical protein n=1 Tax=Neobacillus niacini TaxID=86668 RepID=UPI0014715A35|nr:hypothetical protein [Neobacillus niacini]